MKAAGVLLVVLGLSMRPGAPLAEAHVAKAQWLTSEPEALALAQAQGKPVIIDFGAEWCAACKELEKYVFADDPFVEEAQRFVLVRIDGTDDEVPEVKRLFEKYKVDGLPTVTFLGKDGKELSALTVKGFVDTQDFVARMRQVP